MSFRDILKCSDESATLYISLISYFTVNIPAAMCTQLPMDKERCIVDSKDRGYDIRHRSLPYFYLEKCKICLPLIYFSNTYTKYFSMDRVTLFSCNHEKGPS